MNENDPVHYQDGEWPFLGTTDADQFVLSSGEEYADVGLSTPYRDADVASLENVPQRFVLPAADLVVGIEIMRESIARLAETFRELRINYPDLFEDIEPQPFVSCDAMSVTYGDGREERPL